MLTVKEVLRSKSSAIWSIGPDDMVFLALEVMAEKDIGSLIVMDEKEVIGIFTERDYARKIALKGKSSKTTTVGELMTKDIFTITADKTVDECMALMLAAHCRHMPVFENGKLAGVVTFGDIVNAVIIDQKTKIQDLETYISGCEIIDDNL